MPWVLLLLGILLSSCTGPKPFGAVTYDLTEVYAHRPLRLALRGGTEISIPSFQKAGTRLHFVDETPGANWGHPAEVQVLNAAGLVIEKHAVTLPPRGLEKAPQPSVLPRARPAAFQLQPASLGKGDAGRAYVVILNGDAEQRHWNGTAFLYRVLTQLYGYSRSHIFVADTVYKEAAPDLDGDGVADIEYGSTEAEVRALLAGLRERLTPEDRLLVVVNDHGERDGAESSLVLFDGAMRASTFATLLSALRVGSVVSIFSQCYGGGFVRAVRGGTSLALSAASDYELSWATEDLQFDAFFLHWVSALARQTPSGRLVASDRDGDGRVSFHEAYVYALGQDTTNESPLLESPPNSGLARRLFP